MPSSSSTRKMGGGKGSSNNNSVLSGSQEVKAIVEMKSVFPEKFLNDMGFINYTHLGKLPWSENDKVKVPAALAATTSVLAIDCEMVGVGEFEDPELARVSIVNKHGYCILDTFVKPSQPVTVYNTKKSGIRPEDLKRAPSVEKVVANVKKIVKGKILVGHSIHHDLEVLRIFDHPRDMIRDSSDFFRYRFIPGQVRNTSLKQLAKRYLNVEIQTGEHSSIQDAQASMKLYSTNQHLWEKEQLRCQQWTSGSMYARSGKASSTSIASMHVHPEKKDLFVDSRSVFLRQNKILGKYESSKDYVDVQFRLLLEDFLRPLRDGVRVVSHKKRSPASYKLDRLFRGVTVKVTGSSVSHFRDHAFLGDVLVPIDLNRLRSVDWKMSKMFLNGSLVVLTPDNFSSVYFGVIKYFDEESIEPKSKCLSISVAFNNKSDKISIGSGSFLMMESRAFFEAYKHTLLYLQEIELDNFPMKKYIVDAVTTPCNPHRLLKEVSQGKTVDFSVLLQNQPEDELVKKTANPFILNDWPTATELGLDGSQHAALQQAITQEFTIIQGPPGCGKTFIGVQIVKLLLTNPWMLDDTPIMIVSYTNHALDQTLERLLKFYADCFCSGDEKKAKLSIIRVGGCSQSESIKELTLFHKSELHRMYNRTMKQINCAKSHLKDLKELKAGFASDRWLLKIGILDLSALHKWIPKKLFESIKNISDKQQALPSYCLDFWKTVNITKSGLGLKKLCELKKQNHYFIPSKNIKDVLARRFDLSFTEGQDLVDSLFEKVSQSISTIPFTDAYDLSVWISYFRIISYLREFIENLDAQVQTLKETLTAIGPTQSNSKHLKTAKIIGMTTTGAVKYKGLILKNFKPKVMIVEEAAHVLEAHVVASLTEHCEQMILIGDHKQLRPMTADNSLSWQYKLDVSLMERMVRNGIDQGCVNWVQLEVQHRMRPEIARMVCPLIYKQLKNHPDVEKYEKVAGCSKNLYFMDHQFPEEQESGSKSYINLKEIDVTTALVKFFLENYSASRITVIATYKAQRDRIDTRFKQSGSDLASVRVSTVDGYQGEENDIVILSLVRSNGEGRAGFLKTNNRVCVALSRARHGFYMIGNMSCLAGAAENWESLWETLKEMDSFGSPSDLPLYGPRSFILKKLKMKKIPTGSQALRNAVDELNLRMGRLSVRETEKKSTSIKNIIQSKIASGAQMPLPRCQISFSGNARNWPQKIAVSRVVKDNMAKPSNKTCDHKTSQCGATVRVISHAVCKHKVVVHCLDQGKESSLFCGKSVPLICYSCGWIKPGKSVRCRDILMGKHKCLECNIIIGVQRPGQELGDSKNISSDQISSSDQKAAVKQAVTMPQPQSAPKQQLMKKLPQAYVRGSGTSVKSQKLCAKM